MTMKEWSEAKARMTTEVSRKIEHQTAATRFVESRAYIRTNWKTKKFDPSRNPLLDSSSSEEDEAQELNKVPKQPPQKIDAPQIVYEGNRDMMSPDAKDSRDPYAFEDGVRETLQKIEDKSREINNKSAKTVLKRNYAGLMNPPKVLDFAADPVNLGIRPSTAIQLKQADSIVAFNRSLPPSKAKNALPMISANNIGSISRVEKNKKGQAEIVKKFGPIGMIDDFLNNKDSNSCKVSDLGKVRTVSTQSARKKIELLRRH